MSNEQRWFMYIKDGALEHYISILSGMLERYSTGMYSPEYREKVRASLARLEAEYERRAT